MSQASVTYFISYSREDSEFALRLAQDLRAEGADIWMDQLDIKMGDRWDRKVEQALKKCAGLILIMSPTSVKSDNVLDELDYALEKDKRILPILFLECERPFRIRRRHYVDFTAGYAKGFRRMKGDLNLNSSSAVIPESSIPRIEKKPESGYVDEHGMVFVEGGIFEMGDTFGDGRDNERPVHQVTLDDFWIGRYAVTFEEYDAFCAATGRGKPEDRGWGRVKRPVIYVSWDDAVAYCNWRSEREGLEKVYQIEGENVEANWQAKGYRLPTEAEWEFAARGGLKSKGFKYSGGNELDPVGWYEQNSEGRTHPVGQKLPNELGLYDMTGNVWEWCWDWYGDYSPKPQTNPKGPDTGKYRVLRGGSWSNNDVSCRVTYRNDYDFDSSFRNYYFGFRLTRYG